MAVVTGNNNAVVVRRWIVVKVVEAVHEVEGARVVLLNLKLTSLNSKSAVHTRWDTERGTGVMRLLSWVITRISGLVQISSRKITHIFTLRDD